MPGVMRENEDVSVDTLSSVAELESLLLHTISEAASIEEQLEALLSSSSATASSRALALSKTAQRSAALSEDGSSLCSVLSSASRTASAVSSRVRVLHGRADRTRAALSRVEDVLTLRVCAEGAKTSLSAHDLASAARHVERYLQLDHDVRNDESQRSGRLARCCLGRPYLRIPSRTRRRAPFVPLGMPAEGLRRLANYLSSQIARETDADIRSLLESAGSRNAAGADEVHIAALTRLFEAVAAYLHECSDEVSQIFGKETIVELAMSLQAQCDIHSAKILERYLEARHLDEVVRAVRSDTANARDLDPLLDELTLLSQRISHYFKHLRENYADESNELGQTLDKSSLAKSSGQLAQRYVAIEAYFMRENARKAIRIDEAPISDDLHTSTAVDDFFFVVQKCSQRALAYGNLAVDPNVAVLRHVASVMSSDLLPYVRKRLRETQTALEKMLGGSSFALPTAALSVQFLAEFAKANIATAAEAAGGGGGTNTDNSEGNGAKYDFFVAVNNAATSADYALRFRSTIEKTAEAAKTLTQSDRARLSSALVPVSDVAH
eukprot:IDg12603t1